MKRALTLRLLQQYEPQDSDEQRYKGLMIAFIRENEDCFERSLTIGHLTGSAWLLNNDGTQALLMHHYKLDRWLQLGGHCDGNPDILAVAVKEAQEESGIMSIAPISSSIFDIDVHLIPAAKGIAEHYHYDVRFLLQVQGDETVVQNNESKELRWIPKNRSAVPTDQRSVVRMFEKWVKER